MPSPGTYNFIIHPTDGSVEHTTNATLVLSCHTYSYFIIEWDDLYCTGLGGSPPNFCYLFPICGEDPPVECSWTATFYDTENNPMGSQTGTVSACAEGPYTYLILSGDTTLATPDAVVHDIFGESLLDWICASA